MKLPERLWCSYPNCPCEREHNGVCQFKKEFGEWFFPTPLDNKEQDKLIAISTSLGLAADADIHSILGRIDSLKGGVSAQERMAISNLLAVIHHDGGHYESKHGLLKAVEDAEKKVTSFFVCLDDIKRAVYKEEL